MKARLANTRLGLGRHRVRGSNDNVDCKGPSVLTLGDLQGDQSKVSLKKGLSFIVNTRE
jgi:hypothetical protein